MTDQRGPRSSVTPMARFEFLEARGSFRPGLGLEMWIRYRISSTMRANPELYVYWGHRSTGAIWVDEEIAPSEITPCGRSVFEIHKTVQLDMPGEFGAAAYAVLPAENRRVWQGDFGLTDISVSVPSDKSYSDAHGIRQGTPQSLNLEANILLALQSYERFARHISRNGTGGLGKALLDLAQTHDHLPQVMSDYYAQAEMALLHSASEYARRQARRVLSVLQHIGVGDVMLIAAEGPHAMAGGLSQVIVGFLKWFSRNDIPVTLVTPLYEERNGNKHPGAEEVIGSGVRIDSETVPLERTGTVKVPFGLTRRAGTGEVLQRPYTAVAEVYRAEHRKARIFFLRHHRFADRVYANGPPDDLLRRAIFLARGALEVVREPSFGVSPQIVISNDWHAGLVPVLLKTDPRYSGHEGMRKIETVHMLHNGGRDYQGRIPTHMGDQDLWPMLGISGEHFFGLSDPHDRTLMNMTAGAIFHVTKAILTVSKPYASQLLQQGGAEGLEDLLRAKGHLLFGISNGVDLAELRKIIWQSWPERRGEEARSVTRFSQPRFRKNLVPLKKTTKAYVQASYGLERDSDAILLSFVGRIAEQKGVHLLCSSLQGQGQTVLESILNDFSHVQIFVGGPPAEGDSCVGILQQELMRLQSKVPGRVCAVFDFISHSKAMEIITASDVFLIPSRFEPGGITQLESFAAGTPVIAHRVGGIAATVEDYEESASGCGFLFEEFSAEAFMDAVSRAIHVISHRGARRELIERAARANHDWSSRMPLYLTLLQHVAGVFSSNHLFSYLHDRSRILSSIRPSALSDSLAA